jgi:hypothetical protein
MGWDQVSVANQDDVAQPVIATTEADTDDVCCRQLSKTALLELKLRRSHAPKLKRLETHDGYDDLLNDLSYID